MKNLPENEMMEELKNRLANYTEDPDDDDWDKIAAAIPKGTSSFRWTKYAAMGLLFFLYSSLVWMAGRYSNNNKVVVSSIKSNELVTPQADSSRTLNELIIQHSEQELIQTAPSDGTRDQRLAEPTSSADMRKKQINRNHQLTQYLSGNNGKEFLLNDIESLNDKQNEIRNEIFSTDLISNQFEVRTDTVRPRKDFLIERTDTITITKEIKKKRNKLKPTVYFTLTPSLAFQKIVPFRNDEVLITKLNPKGILSSDRIGFAADIGLQWQIIKKISLYSGLSYYQQNASVSYSYQSQHVKEIDALATPFSYVLSPGISTATFSYKMKNAGVSGGFLYHLQGVKLQHKIGGGLQYQVGLVQQEGNISFKNKSSSYLNYQILYRMEFSIYAKYHFYVQPNYTHLLISKENLYEPMDIRAYRTGIGFGLIYYF